MTQLKTRNIIEGFEDDFEHIKSEFPKSSPNMRLEDFYKFWKEAEMDCLFANRFDPRELLEMITEANRKLVEKITSRDEDLPTRLSALYLTLCISAKQPERLRRKIRMTPGDATSVTNLCADTKHIYSHNNATTSWNLLLEMEAVGLVEERLEYGPCLLDHRKSSARLNGAVGQTAQIESGRTEGDELSRFESILDELNQLGEEYQYLRDVMKLGEVNDATVDIESTGTLSEHLAQAKSLIREYKA